MVAVAMLWCQGVVTFTPISFSCALALVTETDKSTYLASARGVRLNGLCPD